MDTLELIKKHGLSIRQIPYNDVESFVMNDYNNQRLTPEHEIISSVLKRGASKKEWQHYFDKGTWEHTWLEGDTVMVKVARKITPRKHGGWWMTKFEYNTGSQQHWSSKSDNLAPTLESSVALCVSKL